MNTARREDGPTRRQTADTRPAGPARDILRKNHRYPLSPEKRYRHESPGSRAHGSRSPDGRQRTLPRVGPLRRYEVNHPPMLKIRMNAHEIKCRHLSEPQGSGPGHYLKGPGRDRECRQRTGSCCTVIIGGSMWRIQAWRQGAPRCIPGADWLDDQAGPVPERRALNNLRGEGVGGGILVAPQGRPCPAPFRPGTPAAARSPRG